MREAIVVEPRSKSANALTWLCRAIFSFFACIGEAVLKFPNRVFYAVLVVLCILAPLFAIFMVVALLCGVYRRWSP